MESLGPTGGAWTGAEDTSLFEFVTAAISRTKKRVNQGERWMLLDFILVLSKMKEDQCMYFVDASV